ncbi:MAG: DUF3825 domain-containing protein [Acidobacteriota bacterium]|nr:DUF3825 domain-containing protein [Acidobacteriota bacterium]
METTPVLRKPADNLFDFAWMPARSADTPKSEIYYSRLRDLAERAQPERWSFDPAQPFVILGNYLRYTFKRLHQEGKIEEGVDAGGNKVAAFNTGLFTPNYEPIYAFFEANRDPARQPWVLRDFIAESDRRVAFFARRPRPARYFDKPGELIYDPDRELIPNLDHILDENLERYPADLRDNSHRRRMMLQGAVTEAGKRAQMNYKVAVPQFYFGHEGAEPGRIQLLLPLCFESPARADLALVVEREERTYRAFTVLALDRAYNNARLIAKPESDWLPLTGSIERHTSEATGASTKDWVYCGSEPPAGAASTQSLLHTHQAIWCSPPGLRAWPDTPSPGDRLWLVWRDPNQHRFLLLGGGVLLKAPRDLYQTNLLWTDPDAPGLRAEAERQGYGGGTGMSFLRLSKVVVTAAPFSVVDGLGEVANGLNVTRSKQSALLEDTLQIA